MEDFELTKVLGRGAFGKVVLCRERESGTLYAMKPVCLLIKCGYIAYYTMHRIQCTE